MTDSASADLPVAVDRVDRVRGQGEGIKLRLTGRWLGAGDPAEVEPLLVVSLNGRRHRFPPLRGSRNGDVPTAEPTVGWEATFLLPSWAEPRQPGQAALWVGEALIPVPPPGGPLPEPVAAPQARALPTAPTAPSAPSAPVGPPGPAAERRPFQRLPAPPALGEASAWPLAPPSAPAPPARSDYVGQPSEPVFDTGRTGPLAELLFKESVTALHAELDQRGLEVGRLRGALADTRSQLESRTAQQAALESTHADLRAQLQQLMAVAGAQREESERRLQAVRDELTAAEERVAAADGRVAAAEERAAAAEAERDRAQADLALEHERARNDLAAERARAQQVIETERRRAQDELAAVSAREDHRAAELSGLREQLAGVSVAREAAAGEVAGLQAELERLGAELAVAREQLSARGGDLGEAQRLLADARALTEQLRGQSSQ